MLEHRHVRYFIAVAEELNFSRAADRLHMAQPPLSVAIRQLEREVGAELLLRTTREVRLTEAGAAFMAGARRMLEELELAVRTARRAAAGELGSVRVGFSCTTRFETLPEIGRRFRRTHPDVALLTEEIWNANVTAALRSGAIDAALCVCPELGADVLCEPVRSERIVALLPASHRLAARTQLAVEELARDVFMLVSREVAPRLHDRFVSVCRRAGFEPRLRPGGLQGAWELEALVELGLVSLAPESVVPELAEGLASVPLDQPDARLETSIVSRIDETSPVIQALRELATGLYTDAVGATS